MIGIRYLTKADMDKLSLREVLQPLASHIKRKSDLPIQLVDAESEELTELSSEAVHLLHDVLMDLLSGEVKTIIPHHAELTTIQAADILNVSRPYLVGLLESGEIPHREVGRHRCIRMEDVMTYKENIDQAREAILDQMVVEAEELGLYD